MNFKLYSDSAAVFMSEELRLLSVIQKKIQNKVKLGMLDVTQTIAGQRRLISDRKGYMAAH